MKYLPLIVAHWRRKRTRTGLTLGSFAIALFLFGLLVTIRGSFNQGIEVAGADRLVVINRTSLIQPLPLAYRDRLARIAGVEHVTHASWFGGVYQDERNFFAQFAVDRETWRDTYPEFEVPPEQWQAFLADKAGCIAGKTTAERFGWKVGARVPIRGTIFPGDWEFNLRGIYTGSRPTDDLTQFWFRSDYLEEKAPQFWRGYVGWYVVRVADPARSPEIIEAIDSTFANSTFETRAQTEKEMARSFVKQMGNIEFLILAIGGVVFFTLLLVNGNTMAIAVRERTAELAILKAVGFSDLFLLVSVLAESMFIAGVGGGFGLLAAKAFTLGGDPTKGMLPIFYLPTWGLLAGFGVALTVGFLAGLLPAVGAMRLRVVDALRRV